MRKKAVVNEAYTEGYRCGEVRRSDSSYDPRWDFAAAARGGTFDEFKRGFEDAFDGKAEQP